MKSYADDDFFRKPSFPFFIDRYTIRKDDVIPEHSHSFYELVYVVEGDAVHELLGKTYRLSAGDVFILEPRMVHSYEGGGSRDTVVYNVMFQRELLEQELGGLSGMQPFVDLFYLAPFLRKHANFAPFQSIEGKTRVQLESKLQKMEQERQGEAPGYEILVKTQFIEFFVYLSRYMMETKQFSLTEQMEGREWAQWICSMLEESYNLPVTLKEYSRMCGMSTSSFAQKFKRMTGRSFLGYKQELQIKEACRLLRTTNLPIVRIAEQTGYEDLSFFYRVFRRVTGGVTPRQYRSGIIPGESPAED
ncbi:AraC family transcriptional regulator [Paenibacillus gansuensis]|uniref:AraC family transcriptional regulator n=1 Tax=Paenibacillus gansuensis TaxID=306542 RepID=A0ABW5PKV7_9BACL